MATTEDQLEREIKGLPAMPDEQLQNVIQMRNVQRATSDDGRIRLPVARVVSAENSPQIKLEVAHPFIGDISFFLPKPETWGDDNPFVELLDEYGYNTGDMYQLQTERVYIGQTDDFDESNAITKAEHREWYLLPKEMPETPLRERVAERTPELSTVPALIVSPTTSALAHAFASFTAVAIGYGLAYGNSPPTANVGASLLLATVFGLLLGFWAFVAIEGAFVDG